MTFLNPFAWLAALAAAVPLLVHLFSRRKARREAFPTVRFLRQVHRQEVRRLRLREWLLLLLRTLAVLCLALAFGRPAIRGSLGSHGSAPASVVAVVDRSLSMRAAGPQGPRFEEARARLRELAGLLDPGSEAQVILFDRHPAPLFEDFTHDPARLHAAVQALRCGYGGTDLGAALREGARWLASRRGLHREFYVVSDMQASGLDSARAGSLAEVLRGLDVYWVPVGTREAANAAWTGAEATRLGASGEVTADVRNASDEARRGALVEALAGGRLVGAAREDFAPRADTRVEVPLHGLAPADLGVTLRFPHDVLEEDDQVAVAFPSTRPLRVALVGPDTQRLYVQAALQAAPGAFEVQLSADGSGLSPADVWVLLDPERVNAASLRAHLARGGGVLAALGAGAAHRPVELALGEQSPGTSVGAEGDSTGRSFARLRVLDPGHPGFRGLAGRRGSELSSARFWRMVKLQPAPGAVAPAEFGPDLPALLERGHVLLLASPLDGRWNDFPMSPTFVPWLYQTLEALASRARPLAVEVGQRWVRPVPAEWKGLPLRLTDPDGHEVPADLTQGGAELRTAPLERPGLYTLTAAGRPMEAVACTVAPDEADLRALSPAALRALAPQATLVQGSLREAVLRHRFGRELWREFLAAALLLLVLETVVARLTVADRT
ncbi:MAG TPA: BatA domain-containing protein [Candidatus Saccharimonadales bacterium]|nr:BatA domain-containing protein [Candidatus Saccharimonadales bacterium]